MFVNFESTSPLLHCRTDFTFLLLTEGATCPFACAPAGYRVSKCCKYLEKINIHNARTHTSKKDVVNAYSALLGIRELKHV